MTSNERSQVLIVFSMVRWWLRGLHDHLLSHDFKRAITDIDRVFDGKVVAARPA